MLIVVYNFKGGEGKSKISQNLALTMDYSIVTNDVYSPIEKILSEEKLLKIFPNEEFPEFQKDDEIIFDLGGYPDSRVIHILEKAKWIIVPITNEEDNIQVGINSIDTIQKYNKNIIIIANKTEKNDFKELKEDLQTLYDYPIFEIKKSTAMKNITKTKQSIKEMTQKNGLTRYVYGPIDEQFDMIIHFITKE